MATKKTSKPTKTTTITTETPAKSGSKPFPGSKSTTEKIVNAGKGKGKIIAATAGVAAAAAAAGVAYYRGTKGGEASGERNVYHILPGDEGWKIADTGSDKTVSTHSTKKEALSAARELAHDKVPSQLVVHKSDGTIQESWSYDADSV